MKEKKHYFSGKARKSARFPNNKKNFCIFAKRNKNNNIFENFPAGGYATGKQKMENSSKIKVYLTIGSTSYSTEVKGFEFSNKENADAFINLMKSEGYEITTFAGEGYTGEAEETIQESSDANDEVAEAVDAFILNNYGFLKGTDEYDFIYAQIFGLMQSYGYVDRDCDVVEPRNFILFLGYDQFKCELKTNLARYMDWIVEMGGEKMNLFVNCE